MRAPSPEVVALLATTVLASGVLASCQTPAARGAACSRPSECAAPLTCAFGRCRPECVLNRDCPVGSLCLLEASGAGSCALDDDPGCGPSAPCPGALACVDRACVNACASVSECPADARCEPTGDGRARCVRVELPDGGLDAGLDAAGQLDVGRRDAGDGGGAPCTGVHTALAIAAGYDHTCLVRDDRAVLCWGANHHGQIGDGAEFPVDHTRCVSGLDCALRPTPVLDEAGVPLVASATRSVLGAGAHETCALDAMERLVCWGPHDSGQRGPDVMRRGGAATPVLDGAGAVLASGAGPRAIVALVAAEESAYALRADGSVQGWGRGAEGQLGAVMPADRSIPELGSGNTAITASYHALCALSGGDGHCLGQSFRGIFGPAVALEATSSAPVTLDLGHAATTIALGFAHACALVGGGVAACLGDNSTLELGRIATTEAGCNCTRTLGMAGMVGDHFEQIAAGTGVNCALLAGAVWCWGANVAGQAGAMSTGTVGEPTLVGGVSDVVQLAVGDDHTCARTSTGHVYCWGANDFAQLGIGTVDLTAAVAEPRPREVCLD